MGLKDFFPVFHFWKASFLFCCCKRFCLCTVRMKTSPVHLWKMASLSFYGFRNNSPPPSSGHSPPPFFFLYLDRYPSSERGVFRGSSESQSRTIAFSCFSLSFPSSFLRTVFLLFCFTFRNFLSFREKILCFRSLFQVGVGYMAKETLFIRIFWLNFLKDWNSNSKWFKIQTIVPLKEAEHFMFLRFKCQYNFKAA